MMRMSELHFISTEAISILERAGSSGNSTIWRPRVVSDPVLSSAPRVHNWYMEFNIFSLSFKYKKKHFKSTEIYVNELEVENLWGWVHEMELEEVLDSEGLEEEHHVGQIGTLDLRQGCDEHLLLVLALRVKAEALSGTGSSGSAGTLVSIGLADWVDLQRVHTCTETSSVIQ